MSGPGLRLDRWLWHARFARSREIAAELVARRRVRVNGAVASKTHQLIHPGDLVMLTTPAQIRLVRVLGLGARRGTAADARSLYELVAAEG